MEEKIFRTAQRVLVVMECVAVADEDGAVTITDVRSIDLPTAAEVMESLSDSDFAQLDIDFANA